jgi:ABC-type sugar transport system permease subunit
MTGKTKLQILKQKYRKKYKFVLLIIPSLFLYVLFGIYPNLSVFRMSLYDWSPIRTTKIFVGLHNYRMMFTVGLEETLTKAGNTLIYILGLFVLQTILSLILSLALQKNTVKNKFFRAYFFLPMVFSSTMVSMTWAYMYDPNLGIINNILGAFGVEGYPGTNFFLENWQAVILIVVVHIWANLGYPITIITSGLNTISGDLGEAAMIDGANSWQTFWKITFPLLLPTLFRLSLMTITTGAMASDYVVMVGSRTANKAYDTWSAYMYKQTMSSTDYGGVSAAAVLLFFLLAIASLIQFLAMRKVENKVLG